MNKAKNIGGSVSYKSLGKFVRQKRMGLGYNSAEKFASANPGLVSASYVKHIEAADGMFGSPETFLGLAKALGVTPGLMMDILVDFRDFDGNLLQTNNTFTLPDNFTMEDKKLIHEFIEFLGYRKHLPTSQPGPEKAGARNKHPNIDDEVARGIVEAKKTPDIKPPEEPPPDAESNPDQEPVDQNPTPSSK